MNQTSVTTRRRRPKVKASRATAGTTAASEAAVLAQVQEAVAAILGKEVSANEPLMSAGLDSLSAVEFKNDLEGKFGVELPGTLVFDYPSSASIAGFLVGVVGDQESGDVL